MYIRNSTLKRKKPLQRSQKPIQRTPIKRSSKPIKKSTSKESARKRKLSKVKDEIELTALQDGTYFCSGCGETSAGLDKSHIMSVGQYKHLELDPENMVLDCRKCHPIWESGTLEQKRALNNFNARVNYILKHDVNLYNRLTN